MEVMQSAYWYDESVIIHVCYAKAHNLTREIHVCYAKAHSLSKAFDIGSLCRVHIEMTKASSYMFVMRRRIVLRKRLT